MAALGSQSIASSYEQLLHVDADGGGTTTTHVSVKDGDNGTTFGFTIASDALMMSSTNRLEFGDTGTYIHQSADGVLDLVSDTEIEINATTIDMNGAIDLSGDLTLAGDIVFNAAGKGICLGVTSNTDSNTLDDYEEGTWTVALYGNSAVQLTTSAQTGKYTKIGNLVYCSGYILVSSENSAAGPIHVTGLPFTASSGTSQQGGTAFKAAGLAITDDTSITIEVEQNAAIGYVLNWDVTTGTSNVQVSEFSGDGAISFSVTYTA